MQSKADAIKCECNHLMMIVTILNHNHDAESLQWRCIGWTSAGRRISEAWQSFGPRTLSVSSHGSSHDAHRRPSAAHQTRAYPWGPTAGGGECAWSGILCRERGDWRLRIALCSALHAMNCRWQRWLTNNDDNGNLWQWQFMMWMRSMTMTTRTIKGQMQSAAMQSKAYAIKGWWT